MKLHSIDSQGDLAACFLKDLFGFQSRIVVTNLESVIIPLNHGFATAIKMFDYLSSKDNQLLFIGNGGSAAIASHQAIDYLKNGGLRATCFNDSSLLTCISNDYGYEHVFSVPIERLARSGDILIAISSSGKSQNILQGVEAARRKKCSVITLSGFRDDNLLRTKGDLNFYVPSDSYGIVEISHLSILHAMLESMMNSSKKLRKVKV